MFPAILLTATLCLLAGYLYGWHQRGQMLVDSLTGLADKTAFNQDLSRAICDEVDRPRVLCFLDVDQLKDVNDRHGHLAGDRLLEQVATTMEQVFPGRCYRWGGDEFTSLLVLEPEDAEQLAESLRSTIERTPLALEDQQLSVTVSIGLAAVTPGDSANHLLQAADQAMYRCKQGGGNQVHLGRGS